MSKWRARGPSGIFFKFSINFLIEIADIHFKIPIATSKVWIDCWGSFPNNLCKFRSFCPLVCLSLSLEYIHHCPGASCFFTQNVGRQSQISKAERCSIVISWTANWIQRSMITGKNIHSPTCLFFNPAKTWNSFPASIGHQLCALAYHPYKLQSLQGHQFYMRLFPWWYLFKANAIYSTWTGSRHHLTVGYNIYTIKIYRSSHVMPGFCPFRPCICYTQLLHLPVASFSKAEIRQPRPAHDGFLVHLNSLIERRSCD